MLKNLSTTGIVLVTIYLATSIGLVAYAQTLSDPKSKFLFLQLPIVLQHALLVELDLNNLLRGVSWPSTYLALVPPMCVILYLVLYQKNRILINYQIRLTAVLNCQ